MLILFGVGTMAAITLLLATLLVLANKTLHVEEDYRIDALDEILPQANCGACGFPGCRAFAEALVEDRASPASCTVSPPENLVTIADLLGVAVGSQDKLVARLACAGGSNVTRYQAHYTGTQSCRAAAQISGGGKSCFWGCLGFGDCELVCDFDAIAMNNQSLPSVDQELCVACGDCVDVCPKDLFSLQPLSHHLWVACKNLEMGSQTTDHCEVACDACARCAFDAPQGLITMRNNLPVIDYSLNHNTRVPIERCPTGAIVWFDSDGDIVKGRQSKKIIRHNKLEDIPT